MFPFLPRMLCHVEVHARALGGWGRKMQARWLHGVSGWWADLSPSSGGGWCVKAVLVASPCAFFVIISACDSD